MLWHRDAVAECIRILKPVTERKDGVKTTPKISDLQKVFKDVPDAVLEEGGLKDAAATVHKLSKMPRQAEAKELMAAVVALAEKAARAQNADGGKEKPKLRIRRQMELGSIGDDNPVDDIEVGDSETVVDALNRVFEALNIDGTQKDFNIKRVEWTDGETPTATFAECPADIRAVAAKEIVLQRKGG